MAIEVGFSMEVWGSNPLVYWIYTIAGIKPILDNHSGIRNIGCN